MQLLYVIGTGVLAAFCVLLAVRICYQRRYIRTSDRINDCIFRNVAAYLLLIDPDFNVLQTNYRSTTGTAPKAAPSKVGNQLRCKNGEDAGICGTHELCADCPVRAAITGVFRTKKGFSGLEVPMVLYTSDDHTETVDCDVSVAGNFLTVAGQPRVVLTVSDISAQKRTQRELEKARVRAEESDRMKSRFLANMSHELRTPLNAIIGFSELLMDDPAPTEKQEYMRIIRSNGEVLIQQLCDILDLSKIEAGTLGYEYTDVELNAVMEELQGGFRMRQPENSPVRITFHRKISRPLHPHGPQTADSGDRQPFLSNAVKFTSEGSVDFGFEIRGGELYVYVADTGAGIPKNTGDSFSNVSSRRDRSGRASASDWRSRSRSSKRWAAASASNPDRAKARPSGSRSPASRTISIVILFAVPNPPALRSQNKIRLFLPGLSDPPGIPARHQAKRPQSCLQQRVSRIADNRTSLFRQQSRPVDRPVESFAFEIPHKSVVLVIHQIPRAIADLSAEPAGPGA